MIGLDLGDRFSFNSVLDEAGEIILEQKLPTTAEAAAKSHRRRDRNTFPVGKPAVKGHQVQSAA
jgi:hypothetical protein